MSSRLNWRKRALDKAEKGGVSVLILDTAGRSQLDNALMEELTAISTRVHPVETLLVVDSMIGQEVGQCCPGFSQRHSIDRSDNDQDGW